MCREVHSCVFYSVSRSCDGVSPVPWNVASAPVLEMTLLALKKVALASSVFAELPALVREHQRRKNRQPVLVQMSGRRPLERGTERRAARDPCPQAAECACPVARTPF